MVADGERSVLVVDGGAEEVRRFGVGMWAAAVTGKSGLNVVGSGGDDVDGCVGWEWWCRGVVWVQGRN